MRKAIKKVGFCIIAISVLLFFSGCMAQKTDAESKASLYEAVYSNLVDQESQDILRSALINAGVTESSTDILLESVNKYNNAAGRILPVQEGFSVFEVSAVSYNADKLERKWKRKYHTLSGRKNCRLTAFEAIGSLVSYDPAARVTEPRLLVEADDGSAFRSQEDIEKFSVLFNGIESEEDLRADLQAEKIREYWKQAGVCFPEDGKIRLISIWFNGEDIYQDNEKYILHCGHTAVLIDTEEGEVLLLEKLDYNFPYQLIRFPSEEKALQYIVDYNCTETDEEEIVPVVLVNDRPLRMENGRFVY